MTTIYQEKIETKEVTTKERVKTICDWCGDEIPDNPAECDDFDPDTDIKFTEWRTCYDSGEAVDWEIEDLCLNCGRKLKGILVALGVTVKESGYDW